MAGSKDLRHSESGVFLELIRNSAPHTGQSSQLSLDHDDRSAQFLPAVARSALNQSLSAIAKSGIGPDGDFDNLAPRLRISCYLRNSDRIRIP